MTDLEPPARARLGVLQTFAVAGFLFISIGIWSFSSPLMGVPDEPAHTVKAASIWQFELRGQPKEVDDVPVDAVDVPKAYDSTHALPGCYAFYPIASAECAPGIADSGRIVESFTSAGPYPPLYYAIVGWPTRFFHNETGLYLMRLTSVLVFALLVAFGARSLSRLLPRPLVATAFVLALTPTAYFMAAGINPAGLEIAAAVLFWSACLALMSTWGRGRALDRGLVAEFVIGFAVLSNTRSLGLVFIVLATGTVALFVGLRHVRAIATDRRFWILLAPLAVIGAAAALWVLANGHLNSVPGSPLPPGSRPLVVLGGVSDDFLRQMVAIFGWKDTGPVTQSVMPWFAAALALFGVVLVLAPAWRRVVVVLAAIAVVVLPIVLQLETVARDGVAWQGRYLLPFAVGVPILAMMAVAPAAARLRDGFRSTAVAITALCAMGLTAGQWVWLHRATVGIDEESLNPFSWGGWQPPVPAGVLFVLTALMAAVPVVYVAVSLRPSGEDLDVSDVDASEFRQIVGLVDVTPAASGSVSSARRPRVRPEVDGDPPLPGELRLPDGVGAELD